ncbi:MAG: hypothetical protein V1827_03145 [Candidatus Micrarchaeota archaeon]
MEKGRPKGRPAINYLNTAAFLLLHLSKKGELTPELRQGLILMATQTPPESKTWLGVPSRIVRQALDYINGQRKETGKPPMDTADFRVALSMYIANMLLEGSIKLQSSLEIEDTLSFLHHRPEKDPMNAPQFKSALSEQASSPLVEDHAGPKVKG